MSLQNYGRSRMELRPLYKILDKVNALAAQTASLSDGELQAKTGELKKRLAEGSNTDEILPEAFAAAREAARRILGMYPYDVQILGAAALHLGMIAEMKTGEGKTLTAVLPLYLNALTGKSCILVTMNEYLAVRDGTQLKPLYDFLGVSCAIGVAEKPDQKLTAADKQRIYSSDIVYTTHGALGFDYLIENLAPSRAEQYLRPFYYCIIDEADSVLLDSAQTPLVISGSPKVQSNLYAVTDDFVATLKEGLDIETEEDNAWLTENGVSKAERFFRTDNLFEGREAERMRHIVLAMRAHYSFTKDKNYVVDEDELKLLDQGSGRILDRTRLRGGQHQALEQKEHVKLTRETRAMASITFQDFFRLFPKLAGMTGSAASDRKELKTTYGLDVAVIPTNVPMIREDLPDVVCAARKEQLQRAAEEVVRLHEAGQPVLVMADSIATSEEMSGMLLEFGVPHNLLNAYSTAREAMIIAEAGRPFAVTVATAVAGRGTDIRLQQDAAQRGGLAMIGIGRMAYRRLETQARGRSGRQGDPGFSRYYVSSEDDIVLKNGDAWLQKFRTKGKLTTVGRLGMAINRAQRISEENARAARDMTQQFGRTMKAQRRVIYDMRNEVLDGKTTGKDKLMEIEKEVVSAFLADGLPEPEQILRFIMDNISYRLEDIGALYELDSVEKVRDYLLEMAQSRLENQFALMGTDTGRDNFSRLMILKAIDESWIDEVDYLQQLRISVSGRAFAGRDTAGEFHREAHRAFEKMKLIVKQRMMRNLLLGEITTGRDGRMKVVMP